SSSIGCCTIRERRCLGASAARHVCAEPWSEVERHPAVTHPFLRRFAEGGLARWRIWGYASQHYQLVGSFMVYLEAIAGRTPDLEVRRMLRDILDDGRIRSRRPAYSSWLRVGCRLHPCEGGGHDRVASPQSLGGTWANNSEAASDSGLLTRCLLIEVCEGVVQRMVFAKPT